MSWTRRENFINECLYTWQHILYSLPLFPCSSRVQLVYHPRRSPPCSRWTLWFVRHLLSKKTGGENLQRSTDMFYWCCCTQTGRSTCLGGAICSSYKQVGFLVHVQDGEGRGRVGTGRGRHHTGHGAFQRIHWYGAIQPISEEEEKRHSGSRRFPTTEDIESTWSQFLWSLGA